MWLSILGFCGITAVLGVIFGIAARSEAKRRGVSSAKASWAIVIGLIWLLPLAIYPVGIFLSQGKTSSPPTTPVETAAAASAPAPTITTPAFANDVEQALVRLKFTCDASKGVEDWVQCRKGTYKDPTYGPSPLEMVNIWANYQINGSQYAEGYVRASTYSELKAVNAKWTYGGQTTNGAKDLTGSPTGS